MTEFPASERGQVSIAEVGRKRAYGTALAELALTVSLIVSIVVVLAIAGASGVMAATRSDLIMMEDGGTASSLTTMAILTVIAIVMGLLTILALRDVAPAHSKRSNRRTTTGTTTTTISRR